MGLIWRGFVALAHAPSAIPDRNLRRGLNLEHLIHQVEACPSRQPLPWKSNPASTKQVAFLVASVKESRLRTRTASGKGQSEPLTSATIIYIYIVGVCVC